MRVLLIGMALLGFTGTTLAGEDMWPTPPEGWWKSLKGGESATYEMVVGPTVMEIVITINKIEGSKITVITRDQTSESTMPAQKEIIDAAKTDVGALPPGASVKKGKNITLKVGNNSFKCTVYQIEINGMKMKNCHSSQLPPIFNSGVVKMETESDDEYSAALVLKKYTGTLISGSENIKTN
jgi:hypothetical protein